MTSAAAPTLRAQVDAAVEARDEGRPLDAWAAALELLVADRWDDREMTDRARSHLDGHMRPIVERIAAEQSVDPSLIGRSLLYALRWNATTRFRQPSPTEDLRASWTSAATAAATSALLGLAASRPTV